MLFLLYLEENNSFSLLSIDSTVFYITSQFQRFYDIVLKMIKVRHV